MGHAGFVASATQKLGSQGGDGKTHVVERHAINQGLQVMGARPQGIPVENQAKTVVVVAANREGVGPGGAVGHLQAQAVIDQYLDRAGVADPTANETDPALE